jgi:hypothetical protein
MAGGYPKGVPRCSRCAKKADTVTPTTTVPYCRVHTPGAECLERGCTTRTVAGGYCPEHAWPVDMREEATT